MEKVKGKPKAAAIDALIKNGFGLSKEGNSINPIDGASSNKKTNSNRILQNNYSTNHASSRDDIGVIQKTYKTLEVVDTIDQINNLDLKKIPKIFVNTKLISVWNLHDRKLGGNPNLSDIFESIRTEGQEEPCKIRYNKESKSLELIAGFRRYSVVNKISGMYLLCEIFDKTKLDDRSSWMEMTRENNLDRKSPIPISIQVESDHNAIKLGVFKNLTELSLAAGKNESWARVNKGLVESIPNEIRESAGKELMATLKSPGYRKLNKLFKDTDKRKERINLVLEHADIFEGTTSFPINKIEKLFDAVSSSRVRDFSVKDVRAKVNQNGNLTLEITKMIDESKIKEIISAIKSYI